MQINATVDASAVVRALGEHRRQFPFAISKAINSTLLDAQRAMRAAIPTRFSLRSPAAAKLFQNAVKVRFATKTKLGGEILIEGPETATGRNAQVSQMILRHETGGIHTSTATYRAGGRMVLGGFFLPVKGLRSGASAIPRKLYPAAIGAVERKDASGASFFASSQKGRKRMRGQEGRELSYFTTEVGIFERRHFARASAVRLLWAFRRRITLRPRLHFFATVSDTVEKRLPINTADAVTEAIRTAFT